MYGAPLPPQFSDSNRSIIDANPPLLRAYQVWKGSNRFCCGGRLIFGPDARSLFLTISLIVVPVILFCSVVSQRLVKDVQHHLGNPVVAICAIFTAYIILLLLLTSARDPGIVPRKSHPPDPEEETDGSTLSTDWAGSVSGLPTIRPTKDVVVNGMVIKVKYCQTCMRYRPPRCSHCSICNNCVERFDHHCPWVGQCIGKRNYRFFFLFISSTTMLCLYVFAFCWVSLIRTMHDDHCSLWRALLKSPVSGLLIIYTFVCAWFVGGLTGFHLFLIITNQTTYENFRYRYERRVNPQNLGCPRNVLDIFCSKIPPSKNNFREKVKVDPSSIFNHSVSYRHPISPEMSKTSLDLEKGKRHAVAAEDLEEIQNQIDSVAGLERCGTAPPTMNGSPKDNWEITPDMKMLAAEFGMQYGPSPAENRNISRSH